MKDIKFYPERKEARHLLPASFPLNGSHKENDDLDLMRPMMEESEKNLLASLGIAYERIQSEPDIPEYSENEIPSQTLFNRWRHEAQFISEKELQQLWGNILAQEIIKPGSISLRTLDALKNVSAAEAGIFCQLCDYVFQDNCFLSEWPADFESVRVYEIENLFVLAEIGFITNSDEITELLFKLKANTSYKVIYDQYLLLFYIEDEQELTFGRLTSVGKDLYKISKNITLDKAIRFAKLLLKHIRVKGDIVIKHRNESNDDIQLAVVKNTN